MAVCGFRLFQSAVRIAVSLKEAEPVAKKDAPKFQSAVRIAVSLKQKADKAMRGRNAVSIRRADRCLAEDG